MSGDKFYYCWLCARRRLFSVWSDEDGENWRGVVCNHALWVGAAIQRREKGQGMTFFWVGKRCLRIPEAWQCFVYQGRTYRRGRHGWRER